MTSIYSQYRNLDGKSIVFYGRVTLKYENANVLSATINIGYLNDTYSDYSILIGSGIYNSIAVKITQTTSDIKNGELVIRALGSVFTSGDTYTLPVIVMK